MQFASAWGLRVGRTPTNSAVSLPFKIGTTDQPQIYQPFQTPAENGGYVPALNFQTLTN
jgi:hypothetical protein